MPCFETVVYVKMGNGISGSGVAGFRRAVWFRPSGRTKTLRWPGRRRWRVKICLRKPSRIPLTR